MLDDAAKTFAKKNLGETGDAVNESIRDIHLYLRDNPQINAHTDRKYILYFLRSCKFNIELTKNKIKCHYMSRAERSEWFTFRDPFLNELSQLLEIGVFLPLLEPDIYGRQIVIIRTAAHTPSKHKIEDVIKIGRMILDYMMYTKETISVYGIRAIFDMSGVALGHALQMTPVVIKRAVSSWESYPARIQKLEFVNANLGINVVLDIFRSFMSQKMKERVTIRRGKPDFNASDNLPAELGGVTGNYSSLANHWKRVLEQNHQWFFQDDRFKSTLE